MTSPAPNLVSIGYEGRNVDELLAQLKSLGVNVLVDVRLTPISRKPGLSKTKLAAALNQAGIGYVHYRQLGNPKDNRDGYRAGDQESFERFHEVLQTPEASNALHHVSELMDGEVVALLCFEHDHSKCHRAMVAQELQEHFTPELHITYA